MFLPKQIIALKKIVAKAVSRHAHATIRIERHPQGPRAMATDGRRAVVFDWDEPEPGKFPPIEGLSATPARQFAANVPPKTLAEAGRGLVKGRCRSSPSHLLLDESSTSIVRVAGSSNGNVTRAQAKTENAAFPDCHGILPTAAREGNVYDPKRHGAAAFTHTRIGVNAKQLAQTLQVVSDLATDDVHNTVVMTVPVNPDRPIRLDARCSGRRAAAAIMPVAADFSGYDPPQERPHSPALTAPVRKPRRSRKPQIENQRAAAGGSGAA
jgi:hypothetical protein